MKTINTYINEKLRLTNKRTYTCQPVDKDELQQIIIQRINDEGNECDLNDIDVSKIKDMSYLCNPYRDFEFINFNGDVSMWNVSNVENMGYMFGYCNNFNCDLSQWDTSNVKNMFAMFRGCKLFNQDLNSWDVSKVENMWFAFHDCPTTPTWYDKDKWEQ